MVNISLGRTLYGLGLCLLLISSSVEAQGWPRYPECTIYNTQAFPFFIRPVTGKRATLAKRCKTFKCMKRRIRSRSTRVIKWLELDASDYRQAVTVGTLGYAYSLAVSNDELLQETALYTVGVTKEDNLDTYSANASLDAHYGFVNDIRCEIDGWCLRNAENVARCQKDKDVLPRFRKAYKGGNDFPFGESYLVGIR